MTIDDLVKQVDSLFKDVPKLVKTLKEIAPKLNWEYGVWRGYRAKLGPYEIRISELRHEYDIEGSDYQIEFRDTAHDSWRDDNKNPMGTIQIKGQDFQELGHFIAKLIKDKKSAL